MDRSLPLFALPATGDTPAHTRALHLITALCRVRRTDRVVPVASAHISGVSYWNLGPAGLEYLDELAATGRVRVPSTLNPCAFMPSAPPPWVTEEDARLQARVLAAYEAMGVTMSCTCAPYLTQPAPLFGTHLAWAESSAVTVANSLLGARTEREGGPGALAAALCGFTPYTGLHLDANRRPRVGVRVTARLDEPLRMGLLGAWYGRTLGDAVPQFLFDGPVEPTRTGWQALCAAIITYGGPALFHVVERTPEAATFPTLPAQVTVTDADLDDEAARLTDLQPGEGVDLVFSGCPHPVAGTQACFFHRDVPVAEVAGNAPWTLLAAPGDAATSVQGDAATSVQADAGTSVQADAGTSVQAGRILTLPGGCPAVSPLPPEVKTIVTDSAKAAFYLRSRGYRVGLAPTQRCVELGSTGRWPHAT